MLLREPPFLAGRIFTQPQVHHFSSALHGRSFVFPRTVSHYPSFLPSERLRGGGARGGESGHAADGEGEPEAPLEQDGAGGRAEEEKEGVRPYVGLKRGYAALCPYHLLGRRELSCERVGRRNGRWTDACMRKCEIPRPEDLCAGGIGGRDESESETNTSGVPPVRGVRVRGPAGLPAHIIMHLCEPLSRRLGGPAPAPAGIYYLLRFA